MFLIYGHLKYEIVLFFYSINTDKKIFTITKSLKFNSMSSIVFIIKYLQFFQKFELIHYLIHLVSNIYIFIIVSYVLSFYNKSAYIYYSMSTSEVKYFNNRIHKINRLIILYCN